MAFDLGSIFNSGKAASDIFNGRQPATTPPYVGGSAPGAGSAIEAILAGLNRPPSTGEKMADLGSIISGVGTGEQANRVLGGNFQQNYDQMMLGNQLQKNQFGLQAQRQRNENESDALRKLQQAAYIGDGGANYAPPTISLGGRQVTAPSFSFAPRNSDPSEVSGANALRGQMVQRLENPGFEADWSFKPADPSTYTKQGALEKIGSYGGAVTSGIGGLMDILGAGKTAGYVASTLGKIPGLGAVGNVGSKIGSFLGGSAGEAAKAGTGLAGAATGILGKAVPLAGAVTGGIGLMKNQGVGRNIMNGVSTGASIGSIVPGLGTAVGAGIGAAVGGIRSLFGGGPSQQELAGRESASTVRQTLSSVASPQQLAEAQKAGWTNPQDALALIVLRDKIAQQGGSPEQANQLMTQLFQAEKGGPQAVDHAANQIMQLLRGQNGLV